MVYRRTTKPFEFCTHELHHIGMVIVLNASISLRMHILSAVQPFFCVPLDAYLRIEDLHISHNASGMGANIRVLLIRNSSSQCSLDVNGFELPCLAATMCFTRLRNQW